MKMYFTVSTIKFSLGEGKKHIKLVMRETQKYKILAFSVKTKKKITKQMRTNLKRIYNQPGLYDYLPHINGY